MQNQIKVSPVTVHSKKLDAFVRFALTSFSVLIALGIISYTLSENNLFVNEDFVLERIQDEDASVRLMGGVVENNLIRYSVVRVISETGDKKFYVDAKIVMDEHKTTCDESKSNCTTHVNFERVYKVWPVKE